MATLTGWQEYAVVSDDPMLTTPLAEGTDPLAALGVFGSNGLTAYVGLTEIGQDQGGRDGGGVGGGRRHRLDRRADRQAPSAAG